MPTTEELVAFLRERKADGLPHVGQTYLDHTLGVRKLLLDRGASDEIAAAGFFHSIYGTMISPFELLDYRRQREELVSFVGPFAERLVYLNSAMDRSKFDVSLRDGVPVVHDRWCDRAEVVTAVEWSCLGLVHLLDWLEQVPRGGLWGYRRGAYELLADRLGERAAFDKVYAGR